MPTIDIPLITFIDEKIETAQIIRLLLSLIDGSEPPSTTELPDMDAYDALMVFADKWDCKMIHNCVLSRLLNWVAVHGKGRICCRVFIMAARYRSLENCCALIETSDGTWGDYATEKHGHKTDFWTIDPRGWAPDTARRVNPTYIWALMGATDSLDKGKSPVGFKERGEIAVRFLTLVTKWESEAE
jgi:hypothetical protein